MSELIDLDPENIIAILNKTGEGVDFPKPFLNDIFLLKVHIAGTSHIQDKDSLIEKLHVGLKVSFFRETDNKYDYLAILIKNEEGKKLGYIPREKNEVLARLMDAGKNIYGEIVAKEEIDGWNKIDVRVMLKDWA